MEIFRTFAILSILTSDTFRFPRSISADIGTIQTANIGKLLLRHT